MLPTTDQIKALDGKIVALLAEGEKAVLDFYISRGRKYGVSVSILSDVEPEELARARNKAHAAQILNRANSRVSVVVARNVS